MAAAQQILPLLSCPNDGGAARPELEEKAATASLPNLYCVRHPLDMSLDSSGKSVLKVVAPPASQLGETLVLLQDAIAHPALCSTDQVESVEKLFCILCSEMVDAPLRRSAAEQLAVVLQGNVAQESGDPSGTGGRVF